jgi:hypothetical protein
MAGVPCSTPAMRADLEPDPYEVVGEPGQHLVRRDVLPAELVELHDIRWTWPLVSWARSMALADWSALERIRQDGLDPWHPPETLAELLNTAGRDLARLPSKRHPPGPESRRPGI